MAAQHEAILKVLTDSDRHTPITPCDFRNQWENPGSAGLGPGRRHTRGIPENAKQPPTLPAGGYRLNPPDAVMLKGLKLDPRSHRTHSCCHSAPRCALPGTSVATLLGMPRTGTLGSLRDEKTLKQVQGSRPASSSTTRSCTELKYSTSLCGFPGWLPENLSCPSGQSRRKAPSNAFPKRGEIATWDPMNVRFPRFARTGAEFAVPAYVANSKLAETLRQ